MRTTAVLIAILALLGAAAATFALEGLDGATVSTLCTGSTVRSEIGWTDVEVFQLGVPWGNGVEMATDSEGNVYFLVGGYTPSEDPDDPQPTYTGLVGYDGSDFTLLAEYEENQGSGPHTGELMRRVAVSPASAGLLHAGDPVILSHHTIDVGGTLEYSVDLVSVDPSTADQTLLYTFGAEAADATVVIDGDGTIYVGPMSDGSIDRLSYSAGAYSATAVSTNLYAVEGLVIDFDGYLYTFEQGATWSARGVAREILKLDPLTGSISRHGWVDGDVSIFDWTWSGRKLWIAGRGPEPKGKKERKIFVAEAPSGGTAGVESAITQTNHDPFSVAASPGGELLVLESPITLAANAIYEVTPGSGGGGGKPPKKPKR